MPTDGSNRLGKLFEHPALKKPTKEQEPKKSASPETLKEVRLLFDRYAAEVEQSALAESSKAMYIDHANYFIRWLYGGFVPGAAEGMLRSHNRSGSKS